MDQLWQSAPVPALRVWRAGQEAVSPRPATWQLNAAAHDWGMLHGLAEADWRGLAEGALKRPMQPPGGDLLVTLGNPPALMKCRAVAVDEGAVLWLWPADTLPAESPAVALGSASLRNLAAPGAGTAGEANDFLGRALVLADVSVWRVDLATRRVHYNLRGYRQMGVSPSAEGIPLDEVRASIHPDDRAGVVRAAQEALESDRVVDVIARYRNADGSFRTLLTRRVAYRDAHGRPIALAGVSLDLSDLMAERENVLRLRERMDLMAHAVGLGIWNRDVESGLAEWNEQMYRIHHRSPSEGPPSIAEWLKRHVHPLDRERMAREQREADANWTPVYQTEFRIPGDGPGEVRWVYSWSRRENRMGRQMAFGVHIDITDRRSAEQELQRERARAQFAMDVTGMAVWERSLDGTPSYWSERMFTLRGLDPRDPRPLLALATASIAPEDREALLRKVDYHVARGEAYEHEFQVTWPDGTRRWLATRGQVVRDDEGRPVTMTGVNWDITEQKLAQAALLEKQRAEQASRAKSEFMARMSHELRTPMNAVLGFAQLLAEDPSEALTPRQRERLACIRSAGEHLLLLIDDVLDLSRLDADQRPPSLEPVLLSSVCSEAIDWLRDMARRNDVHLDWHPQALSGVVLAERRSLGQIVVNLIGNAIKYNRPGGWVRLASNAEVVEGVVHWRLDVRDCGRGMSTEQVRRVFLPFERLGVEREGIEGTGLGLTIVRQLVERLGGRVAVQSTLGEGSEFSVWLPAAQPAQAGEQVRPSSPLQTSARTPASRMKVLCVEDNPVNMMLVREMLALRPAVTLCGVELGLEGVRVARDWQPDVVLLDLQLPDVHGSEVLRRMREEGSAAHVVALSANAMPQDVQAALDGGFDAYWTKPLDLNEFLGRIDALLARQASKED